ncbi:metallophosphoesterase, partial [Myxococcota bacterium]|nr:metallophosphoesterase [Myxococcota bacterium]
MSASMTTYTLRVLHLSDLHERVAVDQPPKDGKPAKEDPRKLKIRLGRSTRYRVLGPELTKRLDAIVKERRPDLLVFTGDLADWGLHEEYLAAEKRLDEVVKRLGLTWDRVFFVPGNHDIQRSVDPPTWNRLRRFAADPHHHDALSRWLAGGRRPQGAPNDGLDLPAKRQSGYRDLLERVQRPELLPDNGRGHPRLGYRQTLALPGLPPVHIIGLDTAWLAGDDNDKGKLLLTEHQVLLNATNPDDGAPLTSLRLALMHHPLSDLGDAADAHRLLSANVDIVLHGHQHTADALTASNPNHTLRTLAAGSVYEGDEEDKWVNSFHTIDVEMNAEGEPLRYVVQFYAWAPVGGHWHPHAALYRDVPDGRLTWDTPRGLAQPRPDTTATTPPPADALAKFIGRTSQLAALSAALLPPSGQAQAAVVCNLRGMAGVGKSFLIDRFFADHSASFPGGHLKITLGHGAAPSADTLLSELAERLRLQPGPGDLAARVRSALADTRPLLHLDNLDTPALAEAAAELVERLPGVPLILTGRHTFDDGGGLRVIPVAPFEVPEALRQLDAELGEARAKAAKEADKRALVTELGGLPLAIALAGSYLRGGRTIPNFLSLYHKRLLQLTPERPNSKAYQDPTRKALRSLEATFSLSIDALRERLGDEAEAGLPALCALGVAPLSGVRIGWLAAIMGVAEAQAEDWLDKALGLSIVQHDPTSGRWRVHKLLAEHLRQQTDADAAIARMDAWVMERLPAAPDDTRGARWGELQAEHEAVAEWVAGLDGARAVAGGLRGYDYAYASGPYAPWLGAVARGLEVSDDPDVRSDLLWRQGNLAQRAGDLELANRAAEAKGAHDAARGEDREVALAAGLRADILQARGQLDEALRIRWDEVLPVYERLGDVHGKAVTMGKIADILQARGQL